MERMGIIGAGNVGGVLAKRFVELGHSVKIANSRGVSTLGEVARRTGARAVEVIDAAVDVDVLIIAVPFGKIRDLTAILKGDPLRDTVVVDTGNYIPQRDHPIAEIDQGLPETAWVARQLGVSVVKAFNSITTYSLEHRGRPKGDRGRIALPVGGDDPRARSVVARLVEELGFDAVETGPLAESWRQQPGQPAYASDPTLKQLPDLLRRADRLKGPVSRDEGMELLAKVPDFPPPELVRILRVSNGLDRLNPRSWASLAFLAMAMMRARSS